MRCRSFVPLLLLSCNVFAIGQQGPKPKASPSTAAQPAANTSGDGANAADAIPVNTVDFSEGKQLLGLPDRWMSRYPYLCSSDGVVFVEIMSDYDPSATLIAGDLYGISSIGEVTKIQRNFTVPEKRVLSAIWSYPGEDEVATLLRATAREQGGSGQHAKDDYYISLSKRDGTFSRQIKLDIKFEPLKLAVFDSGDFLVLGIDPLNMQPLLALLDSDGSYLRRIDLDARPLAASGSLQAINRRAIDHAGAWEAAAIPVYDAMFVPYGSDVLFFQPGSELPVRIFNEGGEVNAVRLALPKGQLLQFILPAAKNDTWIVRTQKLADFAALKNKGISVNAPQQLFEVDPYSGKVLRELAPQGAMAASVNCAAGGILTALLYYPKQDAAKQNTDAGWKLATARR